MGKPTKPRVKGNLKPASSSRAAELAGGAGNLSFENLGGFAQFAGASPAATHSQPSTPSSMDSRSTDLDPELVVVLKKISKRDTVTKLKALEELEIYLQSNKHAIGVILPNWVAMYSKLVLEVDRRVRLVTNQVHMLITANAKKKLAPLLKELVGPWFLAMYDQSKDVARVAQSSFESVFAKDKRASVISFCQKNILDYVTDMLLFKTAETLSDGRYVSKEDMIAKHARVVASSFHIVSYLVVELSLEERSKCQSEYDTILDDTTMWKKFFTNPSSLIRKSLYTFLRTLLLNWIEMVDSRLDLVSPHFYASVFTEKDPSTHSDMWDALLLMTKKLPASWVIIGKKKPALPKLYHFLRSGLNGSINISYPSVLALLANLPDELKSSTGFYMDVFENFWKGLATEYFDKSNSNIFLNAYTECIVYFAITLSKSDDEQSRKASTVLIESTFWNLVKTYFLNLNDKLDISGYAILSKHLAVISSSNNCAKETMNSFWSNMDTLLVQTIVDCGSTVTRTPFNLDLFCQKTGYFLTDMAQQINDDGKYVSLQTLLQDLVQRMLLASVQSSLVYRSKAQELLRLANQLLLLINTDAVVHDLVKANEQLLQLLVVDESEYSIGSLASYYIGFIGQINNKEASKQLWIGLMKQLHAIMMDGTLQLRASKVMVQVLEHVHNKKIVLDQCDELDMMVKKCVDLNENVPRSVLDRILSLALANSLSFNLLSDATTNEIVGCFKSTLTDFSQYQYIDKKSHTLPEPSVPTFKLALSTLTVLQELFELNINNSKLIQLLDGNDNGSFISEIFDIMFVTAKLHDDNEEEQDLSLQITGHASALWDILCRIGISEFVNALVARVKQSIVDVHYAASPSESVRRVHKVLSSTNVQFDTLLGTEQEWNQLSTPYHNQVTINYLTLATLDPYAALSTTSLIEDEGELVPVIYDVFGLSAFGRLALFLGEYLSQEQHLHHQYVNHGWSLRQLMLTSMLCEQGLLVPGLCRIYEHKAVEGVRLFVQVTHQLFNDWLSTAASKVTDVIAWHQKLFTALTTTKAPTQANDDNTELLDLVCTLMTSEHLSFPLLLQRVMQRLMLLWDWQPSLLEQWLPLLKPEENTLPLLIKVALLTSFKNTLSGNSTYQHYQSDLASKLSGVTKLSQFEINSKHWRVLVLLNASALSFGAFDIPRQRSTYLTQALRRLMLQEEDEDAFDDEQQGARVQAQSAQLLRNMAITMQDISGSHWDFFLQCCFHWLACADTTQPEEFLVVYHALDLLKVLLVEDSHEELQDAVNEHWPALSKVLLDLMVQEQTYLNQHKEENKARLVYQTLLADLLAYIPQKTLIESDHFAQLNGLIHAPNEVLQKRAYLLLQKFIAQRVQDLSVRLEFTETSEEETHADIDKDIFDVLLNPPDLSFWQTAVLSAEEEEQVLHETLAYLLTWMLMFDHFTDITFKLKQEYTVQLKEREAISHLMSVLCKILNIGQNNSSTKMFDLAPWSIVDYDTDGFDATYEMSFFILASHLYYRALTHIPSLVRLWWIDCKLRQLTIAVESYTEKHFSQLLINNEMELINRPDIKEQLEENDENTFTVKTLKAASELTATYRVDEQNMQIAIKLPSNFPLRQIDVESVHKVGVNDKQWRGWMFAVAAVIGSQNGNIVDALTVFKRNVNLHFNGVEDCTICYSIISIQDRSIPTKQCRTCKNKFHSSCLYKWFRSSNSASCPLCRTVF